MLLLVLIAAVTTGCSDDTQPPAAAPTPSASVAAQLDDPPGTLTCTKVVSAVREGTLMTPGVVTDIVTASTTADAPVADEAQRLSTAFTAAVAAHNTDNEPDAIAAVSAAAAAMVKVCGDSGLETVG
ncbi:hypothetical protein AFR_06760 [Actinoplanes friuliensis DSM 7358]|uniref:Uncharacterized protein n=1 Tax=Actinoplanes friuliensis DSM 7358 TaxID=1246995 RepID=U5VVI9_9ACTN|nr:hypothetical protein AFR_06760 [Actinoplanes friuliensis DSM 7358]